MVEQAISSLKAAIKADISRPEIQMSFRQSFISLSTRTLLAPPRGLSAIRPSRIYLATIQREMNNRDEARRQGIPLGHYRTQLLMEVLHRNAGTITVAKCT